MIIEVQLRNDTKEKWALHNPILKLAEQGYETNTKRKKTGDGVTPWKSLPYDIAGASDIVLLDASNNFSSTDKTLENIAAELGSNIKKISMLLNSDDVNLDTIQEIVDYIKGEGMLEVLANKVDKVDGKGLSTNDFSEIYRNKVDSWSADTDSLILHDTEANFKSEIKSVENVFAELFALLKDYEQSGEKIVSKTFNLNINNITLSDVFDFSTIPGTIISAYVDINNTSTSNVMSFQLIDDSKVLHQGDIPFGGLVSFDTQRGGLIVKVKGSGTTKIVYKYMG